MRYYFLSIFVLLGAFAPQANAESANQRLFLDLQRQFLRAPASKLQQDLNLKIQEIESRVSWLSVEGEYLEQDSRWAYQAAAQFFTGPLKDPRQIWRAEHLAMEAAKSAKKLREKILEETMAVAALTVERPDPSAAQEAQHLLKSCKETASQIFQAQKNSSNLYTLVLRYRSDDFQRLEWAAEILDREAAGAHREAERLQKSAHALFQKLNAPLPAY